MENRLKRELDTLPVPITSFEELTFVEYKPAQVSRKKKPVLLIAAVLTLILGGCVWAKESLRYGLWHIYSSHGWSDVVRAAEKFDYLLPEKMDGIPFDNYSTLALVPQGASRLEAYLYPAYRPYCVDYAIWDNTPATLPDGSPTTLVYTEEKLSLSFGTTKNVLYRYYFELDENNIWHGYDVPESYETLEYGNMILQIGDTFFYDRDLGYNRYTRWVHWIDTENEVVFSISDTDYTDADRVVECAKAIIDLNSAQ